MNMPSVAAVIRQEPRAMEVLGHGGQSTGGHVATEE